MKLHLVSPALPCYPLLAFSVARGFRQDTAPGYTSFVGSRDMINANVALKNNPMYSAEDVGEMSVGRLVGPGEIVKYHSNRKQKLKDLIFQYDLSHTYQVDEPTPKFLEKIPLPDMLRIFEKDTLRRLSSKSLPEGYIVTLLKQDYFKKWMYFYQ